MQDYEREERREAIADVAFGLALILIMAIPFIAALVAVYRNG